MSLKILILTPKRNVCNNIFADEVILPSVEGQFGIRPRHARLTSELSTGLLRIKIGSEWKLIIIFGGIVEIADDCVRILVADAEEVETVKVEEVKAEFAKADEQVKTAINVKDKMEASRKLQRLAALLRAIPYL